MAADSNKHRAYATWLVGLAALAAMCIRPAGAADRGGISQRAAPPILVNADEELAGWLDRAEGLIEKGSYDDAIRIVQKLIFLPDGGFVPAPNGRQYAAMWRRANEVLEKMGPKGLALYRRLYDPQARVLYQEAMGRQDTAALRRVTRQYLQTTYGPKALAALGAIYFDRGRFSRSAAYWRGAVQLKKDDTPRALLLAKASVALHLAGRAGEAKKAAEELRRRYPHATGVVGGRRRNLVEFVAWAGRLTGLSAGTAQRRGGDSWGGLGSVPDGMVVMNDCDVVLAPRWRAPGDVPVGPVDIRGRLVAMRDRLSAYSRGAYQPVPKPRKGHVYVECVRRRAPGRSRPAFGAPGEPKGFFLPAAIHPVVVGGLVVCRQDDAVVAYDLHTGTDGEGRPSRPVWATFNLPMYRGAAAGGVNRYYGSSQLGMSDIGRYAMTAAGDRVYLLAGFCSPLNYRSGPWRAAMLAGRGMADGDRLQAVDTSVLAAISISGQGKLVWSVGGGVGGDNVIRGGKFLAAPTVWRGRLYTVVLFRKTYYLVCLAADSGRLIWRASISQAPLIPRQLSRFGRDFLERGSTVAVAEETAFVITNAGVIAAYDADSGAPLWAYQYDSTINQPVRSGYSPSVSQPGQPSANPVVVARGRVICLPADSRKLIVLAAVDGRPLSPFPDRCGQSDLSAIDEERVLLSGPDMVVVSTGTGKELYHSGSLGIVGRPAVTSGAILAGGQGKLIRVNLADYSQQRFGFASGECLLGNLVCVDGILIAANASGVCAYLDYRGAWRGLAERIDRSGGLRRLALMFRRGQLSFSTGQFDKALEDFVAALRLARESQDTGTALQVRSWLYRTHVAMGNRAASRRRMQKHFERAAVYARSDQDHARIKMRLARNLELQAEEAEAAARDRQAAGDGSAAEALRKKKTRLLAQAVALAGQIAETYGQEKLPDLQIGPKANPVVRDDRDTVLMEGRKWAQETFIAKLLAEHGRDCYAASDAQAGKALQEAVAEDDYDAMLDVAKRWASSLWAAQALFEAGSSLYRKATAAGAPDEALLVRAGEHLAAAAARTDDARLAVTALAGMAMVQHGRGMNTYARSICRRLRARCRREQIALSEMIEFGQSETSIADLVSKLEGRGQEMLAGKIQVPKSRVTCPLGEQFTIKSKEVYIVRDREYRPIRRGQNILLLDGARAVWLDTTAESAADAVVWRSAELSDTAWIRNTTYPSGYGVTGGFSNDGEIVVLADQYGAAGFDVDDGQMVWRGTMSGWGVSACDCVGLGEGVLVAVDSTGRMVCVDLATGQVLWRNKLVGGRKRPDGPPRIGGGMVLVRSNGYKTVTCFDIANGGRVIGKWPGGFFVDGRITDGGLLVVMCDGKLGVYDKARMDRPLWTKQYPHYRWPVMLAADGGRVFVSEGTASPRIDVLGIGTGQRLAGLEVRAFPQGGICVSAASPAERYLYVTLGSAGSGRRGVSYGGLTSPRGLGVQKLDMETGKVLWGTVIDADPNVRYYALPLTPAGDVVALTTRPVRYNRPRTVRILDAGGGQTVQTFAVFRDRLGALKPQDRYRLAAIGPAVVTDGRLCVETLEGITVYGAR